MAFIDAEQDRFGVNAVCERYGVTRAGYDAWRRRETVIHGHVFDNAHALRMAISRYTRRYNRTRMHSSLNYRSPIDYERLAA